MTSKVLHPANYAIPVRPRGDDPHCLPYALEHRTQAHTDLTTSKVIIMAVMLAPLAATLGNQLLQIALSEARNARSARKHELAILKTEARSRLKALEIASQRELNKAQTDLDRERIQAQRDIALRILDLAQHAFDRKADMLQSMYDNTVTMISDRIRHLNTDQRAVRKALLKTPHPQNLNSLIEQERAISTELADLNKSLNNLNTDFSSAISLLSISLNTSSLPRLSD